MALPKKCKHCKGADGSPKEVYGSFMHAVRVALSAQKSRNTALRAYRCPRGPGWHLTSRNLWKEET